MTIPQIRETKIRAAKIRETLPLDPKPELHPGLDGIFLSTTRMSRVDGERGSLVIGGYPVEEIAPKATFEETVLLLWTGRLPDPSALEAFRQDMAERRSLPTITIDVLRQAADRDVGPMDALRMAAGTLDWPEDPTPRSGFDASALALLARLPMAVAAFERLRRGSEPVEPKAVESKDQRALGFAAAFLFHLNGSIPAEARGRALNTYLNTVIDHGLNASTFTARVIISTRASLSSAIIGALGALSGPLHGGAPGPALDQVRAIDRPELAEAVLREKLERGERLMGFGHRVYKVRDPRAEVLGRAAEALFSDGSATEQDRRLFALAKEVESVAIRLLDEHKPGRRLRTNVEFYTALLLHGLGLPSDLFTPVFAIARTGGWIAHAREQQQEGRLIRPRLSYQGPIHQSFP